MVNGVNNRTANSITPKPSTGNADAVDEEAKKKFEQAYDNQKQGDYKNSSGSNGHDVKFGNFELQFWQKETGNKNTQLNSVRFWLAGINTAKRIENYKGGGVGAIEIKTKFAGTVILFDDGKVSVNGSNYIPASIKGDKVPSLANHFQYQSTSSGNNTDNLGPAKAVPAPDKPAVASKTPDADGKQVQSYFAEPVDQSVDQTLPVNENVQTSELLQTSGGILQPTQQSGGTNSEAGATTDRVDSIFVRNWAKKTGASITAQNWVNLYIATSGGTAQYSTNVKYGIGGYSGKIGGHSFALLDNGAVVFNGNQVFAPVRPTVALTSAKDEASEQIVRYQTSQETLDLFYIMWKHRSGLSDARFDAIWKEVTGERINYQTNFQNLGVGGYVFKTQAGGSVAFLNDGRVYKNNTLFNPPPKLLEAQKPAGENANKIVWEKVYEFVYGKPEPYDPPEPGESRRSGATSETVEPSNLGWFDEWLIADATEFFYLNGIEFPHSSQLDQISWAQFMTRFALYDTFTTALITPADLDGKQKINHRAANYASAIGLALGHAWLVTEVALSGQTRIADEVARLMHLIPQDQLAGMTDAQIRQFVEENADPFIKSALKDRPYDPLAVNPGARRLIQDMIDHVGGQAELQASEATLDNINKLTRDEFNKAIKDDALFKKHFATDESIHRINQFRGLQDQRDGAVSQKTKLQDKIDNLKIERVFLSRQTQAAEIADIDSQIDDLRNDINAKQKEIDHLDVRLGILRVQHGARTLQNYKNELPNHIKQKFINGLGDRFANETLQQVRKGFAIGGFAAYAVYNAAELSKAIDNARADGKWETHEILNVAAYAGRTTGMGVGTITSSLRYVDNEAFSAISTGMEGVTKVIQVAATGAKIASFIDRANFDGKYGEYYKAELGVRSAGMIVQGFHAAVTLSMPASQAAPMLGLATAIINAIQPGEWANWQQLQDRIDAIPDSVAGKDLKDLLKHNLGQRKLSYGLNTGLQAGMAIAAAILAASGVGAPAAAVVGVFAAAVGPVISWIQQSSLEAKANNKAAEILDRMSRDFAEISAKGSLEGYSDQEKAELFNHYADKDMLETINKIYGIGGVDQTDAEKKYTRMLQDYVRQLVQPFDAALLISGRSASKEALSTLSTIKQIGSLDHTTNAFGVGYQNGIGYKDGSSDKISFGPFISVWKNAVGMTKQVRDGLTGIIAAAADAGAEKILTEDKKYWSPEALKASGKRVNKYRGHDIGGFEFKLPATTGTFAFLDDGSVWYDGTNILHASVQSKDIKDLSYLVDGKEGFDEPIIFGETIDLPDVVDNDGDSTKERIITFHTPLFAAGPENIQRLSDDEVKFLQDNADRLGNPESFAAIRNSYIQTFGANSLFVLNLDADKAKYDSLSQKNNTDGGKGNFITKIKLDPDAIKRGWTINDSVGVDTVFNMNKVLLRASPSAGADPITTKMTINAGNGSDNFVSGVGNFVFDGGEGQDSATYSGLGFKGLANVIFTVGEDGTITVEKTYAQTAFYEGKIQSGDNAIKEKIGKRSETVEYRDVILKTDNNVITTDTLKSTEVLVGSKGADQANLVDAKDVKGFLGGLGNDTIKFDAGLQYIDGGDGNDRIEVGENAEKGLQVTGGQGNDTVFLSAGLIEQLAKEHQKDGLASRIGSGFIIDGGTTNDGKKITSGLDTLELETPDATVTVDGTTYTHKGYVKQLASLGLIKSFSNVETTNVALGPRPAIYDTPSSFTISPELEKYITQPKTTDGIPVIELKGENNVVKIPPAVAKFLHDQLLDDQLRPAVREKLDQQVKKLLGGDTPEYQHYLQQMELYKPRNFANVIIKGAHGLLFPSGIMVKIPEGTKRIAFEEGAGKAVVDQIMQTNVAEMMFPDVEEVFVENIETKAAIQKTYGTLGIAKKNYLTAAENVKAVLDDIHGNVKEMQGFFKENLWIWHWPEGEGDHNKKRTDFLNVRDFVARHYNFYMENNQESWADMDRIAFGLSAASRQAESFFKEYAKFQKNMGRFGESLSEMKKKAKTYEEKRTEFIASTKQLEVSENWTRGLAQAYGFTGVNWSEDDISKQLINVFDAQAETIKSYVGKLHTQQKDVDELTKLIVGLHYAAVRESEVRHGSFHRSYTEGAHARYKENDGRGQAHKFDHFPVYQYVKKTGFTNREFERRIQEFIRGSFEVPPLSFKNIDVSKFSKPNTDDNFEVDAVPPKKSNDQFPTFSSIFNNDDKGTGHAQSAINSKQAWSAASGDKNPSIVIPTAGRNIDTIYTRGRYDEDQWVKTYTADYQTADGSWHTIKNDDGTDRVFTGNNDRHTLSTNKIAIPGGTTAIRIKPATSHGHVSMRVGLGDPHTPAPQKFSFVAAGSAKVVKRNKFVLTPDKAHQAGAVWGQNKFNLNEPLSVEFSANFGNRSQYGADGIMFVLHNHRNGTGTVGASGYGVGGLGIYPSITVKFDTYRDNVDPQNTDHNTDFVQIEAKAPGFKNVIWPQNFSKLPLLKDGNWHDIQVTWNPERGIMNVYHNGNHVLSQNFDLNAIFGDERNVHLGFTGGTGAFYSKQEVQINSISHGYGAEVDNDTTRRFSSVWGNNEKGTGHAQSMLNSPQAWSPAAGDPSPSVVIPVADRKIDTIYTQGRGDGHRQWVTAYKAEYQTSDGKWHPFLNGQGRERSFTGNSDSNSVVANRVVVPDETIAIRIRPQTFNDYPSMRVGLGNSNNPTHKSVIAHARPEN